MQMPRINFPLAEILDISSTRILRYGLLIEAAKARIGIVLMPRRYVEEELLETGSPSPGRRHFPAKTRPRHSAASTKPGATHFICI